MSRPWRCASATNSASVAASRRPRLSPCAPIGGTTCAASPTRAIRLRRKRTRGLDRQRKHAAPGLDAHLAEDRMRAALDLDGELRVGHGGHARRAFRIEHANQARTPAGQGNKRERTGLGVKFRRCIVVWPRVREIERERGLAAVMDGFGAGSVAGAEHTLHPLRSIPFLAGSSMQSSTPRDAVRLSANAHRAREALPREGRQGKPSESAGGPVLARGADRRRGGRAIRGERGRGGGGGRGVLSA